MRSWLSQAWVSALGASPGPPPPTPPPRPGRRIQHHGVSGPLPLATSRRRRSFVAPARQVGAEVAVGLVPAEHVVARHRERVNDCNLGPGGRRGGI